MSDIDITIPATDVDIAEAIMATSVDLKFVADILRRLAFERDRLRADANRWRKFSEHYPTQAEWAKEWE